MMRNKLNKVYNAMGIFKHPSSPQTLGFASNVRSERSSIVRPEPCEQKLTVPNAEYAAYEEWLSDHPSALVSFEEMMTSAKGKKIVMFLDYDGTLSPIVDDPELAFMSDKMRSAVREVAGCFPTAIISGRSRDKVHNFVKLNEVYYAGSHGMDIMAPPRKHKSGDFKYQTPSVGEKGNSAIFQPAQEFLPEIEKIFDELEKATKVFKGVTVEDNRFCISVHYRRAEEKVHSDVKRIVKSVVDKHSRFHKTEGKKVWEVRPSIKWNKGNALEYLLNTLGFDESSDVLPIYIGDDRTDEDAFEVLQKRGQGFSILVSQKPKETRASYSLRDPSEVLTFLLRLAKWRQDS
ncbi:probable trehalose-phosphate phosphatase 6 [Spinacia oleracea]|uniref:Trehalose 6-phosphate phosphatase n=1 Tax=Spinacia oleracea TaxID=3562 RepID=A0ABM3RFI4_SPIOL|nr:probable trehalose-phosphate phosphatase 6 [Spinacia oleracea]XP_056694377.1 probable trehalose-phosphate phosphatase 6 [Spinacia oleracea]XP_056694378.1 probable trehalose-phosphate phosphatase 6 [Spinacia oleracea]XP_056694380.1 probable trehalose-phosphate phosphatase 6 [Spinacia oleracea]XP_056694381.1 probable trehalose-phosphate phosphatase 6 [Spinacia oleracea]XP_056694382.1 probable trehalose-phosphate phosphatase 6 [Spinacia oleracea]XP_056694383.1 probable trehalose-phosphate pho